MTCRRAVFVGLFVLLGGHALAAEEPSEHASFFDEQVAPILVGRCLECHGATKKGGLDLRTRQSALQGGESGDAITPGKPNDSLLYENVSTQEMPPKKPLTEVEIAVLKKWIAVGAYFPKQPLDPFSITTDSRAGFDWWSLQPLEHVQPPDRDQLPSSWRKNAIDRFVFARLAASDLRPSPPADPGTLIRRATYDLIGLPPTPAEVANFLAACQRETGQPGQIGQRAYEALIDRLLASTHYGEHWGRHWLDVVRFGESNGFERNVIINNVWPFRDYVIRSFNEDKPFDQFALEHLAGDALNPDDPQVAVGTSFLVCGPYDNVGNQDAVAAAQIRANTIDEMIRAASEAFLGLTVGCSRCHDHKFDPISQRDYYRLYATFAGVRHGDRPIAAQNSERHKQQLASVESQTRAAEKQLSDFQPVAFAGKTVILDDEMPQRHDGKQPGITPLKPGKGHGSNPAGIARGYRDDPGDQVRTPNISGGRYRWWTNQPQTDLFCWNPAATGTFRVWLSWGCGWDTHTGDAQYLLDRDGDLATTDDQQLIATVDQRHFAGGGPQQLPKIPLWSGLLDAGVHLFEPQSRIVLRGGKTGEAITADVLVLQQAVADEVATVGEPRLPRLRRPVDARVNADRFKPIRARYVRFTVTATNSAEPCIDELEIYTAKTAGAPPRNVAAAASGGKATSSGDYAGDPKHQLPHVNDGKYGNGRSWISNQAGAGWVQIEFADEQQIDHIVWGRDREEKFRDRLATHYRIEIATQPGQWQVVATSLDRIPPQQVQNRSPIHPLVGLSPDEVRRAQQLTKELTRLQAEAKRLRSATPSQKWWVGNFQQADGPFHVFIGGSPQRKGDIVTPASMQTLARAAKGYQLEAKSPERQRRLALANWIVAPDNPLTPRVLANRLWHYHFGKGIVDTPSDFGYMGGRPTHPRLLDYLAATLKEDDWRLKPLHRRIMLSQTYQQSGAYRAAAAQIDGDSRLLWRFPPRRLSSEEIRDTALFVAGRLDTRMGGPGFRLFRYVQDNVATYHPLDVHGPDTFRRAVYHHNARAMQIDLMSEFDAPDCAFSVPRRSSTTTPLQALTLLNHRFTIDMAGYFAERLEREAGGDNRAEQVRHAFLLALSRQPDALERAAAQTLIDAHGLRAFCRALLNANELIYVR